MGNKIKQEQSILLLALYILKKRGHNRPPKKQVLGFIEMNVLIDIPQEDLELRESNGEVIWKNELAWRSDDLKNRGYLRKPEHGLWQITEIGEEDVRAWAKRVKEYTDKKPEWEKDFAPKNITDEDDLVSSYFRQHDLYLTKEVVKTLRKIAEEEKIV